MNRALAMRHMSGRSLKVLAKDIESYHQAAHRAARVAIDHALRCGEMLLEAKAKVAHGEWLPWLAANTTIGARQAQNYMRLARNKPEIEARKCAMDSYLTLREAVALIVEPKPESLREHYAKRVNDRWARCQEARRGMVNELAEARQSLADDEAFKAWLAEQGIGEEPASVIVDLLDLDDGDAWDNALVAALERAIDFEGDGAVTHNAPEARP